MSHQTVYLDYAATSAVRPKEVVDAVARYLTGLGGTPGRGAHRVAADSGRIALRCRMALARLLNLPGDPGRLAFTFNATHSLNTALWGVLRAGDAVVVTAFDHNSVLRPVHMLARERGVEVRFVPGYTDGSLDEAALDRALAGARLLVINAVSNVLGTALPVRELTRRAHDAGALVLVDAAQAVGHLPIDAERDGFDMLAFSGHKGLLGPQGVGCLWVRPGIDVAPLLAGGTGGDSLSPEMPAAYPDHLEAGTLNGPGIAGLLAGVEFIERQGLDSMRARATALKQRLREGLLDIPGVRVLSPASPDGGAIVTFVSNIVDPPTLAGRLDREFGVLTRAGLHCAPEVHRLIGTASTGAVRMSIGWATTEADVDSAIDAVASLAGARQMHTGAAIGYGAR